MMYTDTLKIGGFMNRPSLLVLVRHCESKRNQAMEGMKVFLSEKDKANFGSVMDCLVPLTKYGVEQAEHLGIAVKKEFGVFDAIIHSGYVRSRETAWHIYIAYTTQERSRVIYIQNILLRERNSGYTFHMTREEANKNFPFLQEHWNINGHLFGIPPGGESIIDVATRFSIFLESIYRDFSEKKICVVTHGNLIRAAHIVLQEMPIEDMFSATRNSPPNGSVSAYTFSEKQFFAKCIMKDHVL